MKVVKASKEVFYMEENVHMHAVILDCIAIGKAPGNLMDTRVLNKVLKQACAGKAGIFLENILYFLMLRVSV